MAKILIIDDDEIMNEMIVQMLLDAGYEVKTATDGNRGLKLLNSEQFDLIVTDLVMPQKEGIETIIDIRKSGRNIPIIAISGGGRLSPDNYLSMAEEFGADYTFKKPFKRDLFLAAIKECLGEV